MFVDDNRVTFNDQGRTNLCDISPSQVVREGLTHATTFQIKNYFSSAIAPYVLKQQDVDMLVEILKGKHVNITFSDMYVNSALQV